MALRSSVTTFRRLPHRDYSDYENDPCFHRKTKRSSLSFRVVVLASMASWYLIIPKLLAITWTGNDLHKQVVSMHFKYHVILSDFYPGHQRVLEKSHHNLLPHRNNTTTDNKERRTIRRPITPSRFHARADKENSDHLSACLLVMDENPRLSEWIAYHYFALRLRYLVVGVDPRSIESPSPIFERWRRLTGDLTIIQWNEAQHFPTVQKRESNWTHFHHLEQHYELRQRKFIKECTIHMKRENKTFVAYHDVDEYLTINEQQMPNTQDLASQPDNVWNILTTMDRENATRGNFHVTNHTSGHSCFLFARRMFPPKASPSEKVHKDVPTGWNAFELETLRWRHHTNRSFDGPGKTILDVSRIPMRDLRSHLINPHTAIQPVCQNGFSHYTKLLGYHHYAGSSELFFRKNDSRVERISELWSKRSTVSAPVESDEIRPWLQGFINMVGQTKAASLLKDAGKLEFKFLVHKNKI